MIGKYPLLPWVLEKATEDPFTYLVRLVDGELIRFTHAEYNPDTPEWITLFSTRWIARGPTPRSQDTFDFERGLCIRLDQIVWVVDAPYGS